MIKIESGKLYIDFKRNPTENNKTDYAKWKWPTLWVGIISLLIIAISVEVAFEFKFFVMLLSIAPAIILVGLSVYIMVLIWKKYTNITRCNN